MAIKYAGYDGEPEISNMLLRSNWNKDHVQVDFDPAIDCNKNGGMIVDFVKKWEDSFEKAPPNLKKNLRLEYLMHPKAWKVVMLE